MILDPAGKRAVVDDDDPDRDSDVLLPPLLLLLLPIVGIRKINKLVAQLKESNG
jgi:hypothetical protein